MRIINSLFDKKLFSIAKISDFKKDYSRLIKNFPLY